MGYSPWGCKESDMTERLRFTSFHRLNGDEFEQTLEDSEGQGRLVCCSPWGHKELDMTERLNNNSKVSQVRPDLQYPW